MKHYAPSLLVACAVTGCASLSPVPERALADGTPARFGETVAAGGVRVTPLALVEDSRCPHDVQCVWAGRVRIAVRLSDGGRDPNREVTLGEPVPVRQGTLTLAQVIPERRVDTPIAPADYRFIFASTSPQPEA